jgi:hypothetical protein
VVASPVTVLHELVVRAGNCGGSGCHTCSGAGQKATTSKGLGFGCYGVSDGRGRLVGDGFHSFSLDCCACECSESINIFSGQAKDHNHRKPFDLWGFINQLLCNGNNVLQPPNSYPAVVS